MSVNATSSGEGESVSSVDTSPVIPQIYVPPVEGEPLTFQQQLNLSAHGFIGYPEEALWRVPGGQVVAMWRMSTTHLINATRIILRVNSNPIGDERYAPLLSELNRRNDARVRGYNIEPPETLNEVEGEI